MEDDFSEKDHLDERYRFPFRNNLAGYKLWIKEFGSDLRKNPYERASDFW